MKPGYKTTEFWLTLVTNAVGIAVLMGAVSPEAQEPLVQAAGQLAGGVIAAVSALGYALSRGKAKQNGL